MRVGLGTRCLESGLATYDIESTAGCGVLEEGKGTALTPGERLGTLGSVGGGAGGREGG